MERNVASQKWTVFAFSRTTNAPVTGDAANITAKIAVDDAAAGATNDTNPTEVEDGYYVFDLTQAETNGKKLQILPESSTSNVQVIGVPGVVYTTAANASLLGINGSGHVSRVTLTDTTTTNTDMRGTDSALTTLGSNAPAGWINEAAFADNAITDAKVAADVTIASVAGAVGSVTGNVGGNVVGSVASVVGAVGSVTGNVGGIAGTINTLDQLDAAQDAQHSTTQGLIASGVSYLEGVIGALSIPSASDIATAVWAAGTRTLTGFGTLVADIWASASRTLTAFTGFQINSDVTDIKAKTDNLPASPAATGDIPSADIAAIKAKTDQLTFTVANKVDATAEATVDENAIATAVVAEIGGTTITVVSPVTSASTIELVQGDDYYHADSRALTFTLTGTLPAYTDATTTLQLESGRKVVVVSGTVVTATGDTRVVRFEVTKANTKLLPETDVGQFRVVVVLSNGHETTPATGALTVVRKVT